MTSFTSSGKTRKKIISIRPSFHPENMLSLVEILPNHFHLGKRKKYVIKSLTLETVRSFTNPRGRGRFCYNYSVITLWPTALENHVAFQKEEARLACPQVDKGEIKKAS